MTPRRHCRPSRSSVTWQQLCLTCGGPAMAEAQAETRPRLVVPAYFHPALYPDQWEWLAGHAPQVRLVAHSIKGAAASVSGPEIRDASSKLEQQGRDGDLTASPGALRELSASFERARPVMENFCREDAGR